MARSLVVPAGRSTAVGLLILINSFAVGAVLMGFEMLGSRYIYPYFGAGIATWAALISVVLMALAIGYFIGGSLAIRANALRLVGILVAAAAIYLAVIPLCADNVLSWILAKFDAEATGQFAAAIALALVPLALLGTISPVAVATLTTSAEKSGTIAGWVYGISTIGNIAGVLLTTFYLVPAVGSRAITYGFAALLATCALTLFLAGRR